MTSGFSAFDHAMMTRALRLAAQGEYTTKPNPMVGCVIVKDEATVGEGFHVRAGEPHAEVHALRMAGDRAKGATAYVTLEPCSHHGRTPPCADALIEAGVARVVIAALDPYTEVDGKGAARLREAGIAVETGLMESDARRLNRGFYSRLERGRPWVTVKLGSSLDGRTALESGASRWITSAESRDDVHRLRARMGAVLTGAGTVLADDPSLTVRLDGATPFVAPLRVVLDAGLATIVRGRVRQGDAPTLYVHAKDTKLPRDLDAELAIAPVNQSRFDLLSVLHLLAARNVNEVLVEAGATLAGAFMEAKLVDELIVYQAPVLLGAKAKPLFESLDIETMDHTYRLRRSDVRMVGEDLRLTFVPAESVA